MLENTLRRLSSLAELTHLRFEAMQLFEQCLTNGDVSAMVAFIEEKLAHDPPPLQLLRDIANDLQQRLLSLREYHFDTRDRVVSTLNENYSVDISPLAPPARLDHYHHLIPDEILLYVQENNSELDLGDVALLQKMIESSLKMAAQLYNDIQLTTKLYNLTLDWTEAMNVTVVRQYWHDKEVKPGKDIHH